MSKSNPKIKRYPAIYFPAYLGYGPSGLELKAQLTKLAQIEGFKSISAYITFILQKHAQENQSKLTENQ